MSSVLQPRYTEPLLEVVQVELQNPETFKTTLFSLVSSPSLIPCNLTDFLVTHPWVLRRPKVVLDFEKLFPHLKIRDSRRISYGFELRNSTCSRDTIIEKLQILIPSSTLFADLWWLIRHQIWSHHLQSWRLWWISWRNFIRFCLCIAIPPRRRLPCVTISLNTSRLLLQPFLSRFRHRAILSIVRSRVPVEPQLGHTWEHCQLWHRHWDSLANLNPAKWINSLLKRIKHKSDFHFILTSKTSTSNGVHAHIILRSTCICTVCKKFVIFFFSHSPTLFKKKLLTFYFKWMTQYACGDSRNNSEMHFKMPLCMLDIKVITLLQGLNILDNIVKNHFLFAIVSDSTII